MQVITQFIITVSYLEREPVELDAVEVNSFLFVIQLDASPICLVQQHKYHPFLQC